MRSKIFIAVILSSAIAQHSRTATDPIYTCPLGYELQEKTCVKQVIVQPELKCPEGTIMNGMECIRDFPKQRRCPPGSVEKGKQCVVNESEPAVPVCPIGFTDTGSQCETKIGLDIVEYCPKGTREGPDCVTIDIAPYETSQNCPPGYERAEKGGCWKLVTYDCTPHGGKNAFRSLAGNARPAHAKLHITQQICERKESAPMEATRVCPPGFEDTGSACVVKHHYPVMKKCVNGLSEDQCYTVKNAPYKYDCLNGGILEGNLCLIQRYTPSESYCVQGIDNGVTCALSEPALTVCPPGLLLSGGVCVGTETAQPEVTVTVKCTGKNCYH